MSARCPVQKQCIKSGCSDPQIHNRRRIAIISMSMNEYKIVLVLKDDPKVCETLKVKCNNVPCAVQKAVVLAIQKTRKTGWVYRSHRLVTRSWEQDVPLTQYELQKQLARGIRRSA